MLLVHYNVRVDVSSRKDVARHVVTDDACCGFGSQVHRLRAEVLVNVAAVFQKLLNLGVVRNIAQVVLVGGGLNSALAI